LIITILGQDYDYGEVNAKTDIKMDGNDGYCDGYGKIIRVNDDYNSAIPTSVNDLERYKKQVKRHEIIHAFFEESGLEDYKHDELIVEWSAKQFPKMITVFTRIQAL
jgi:hypothetical protein